MERVIKEIGSMVLDMGKENYLIMMDNLSKEIGNMENMWNPINDCI